MTFTIAGLLFILAILVLYGLGRALEYLLDEPGPLYLPPPPASPPPPVRRRAPIDLWDPALMLSTGRISILCKCPYCGIVSREPERCASCGAPR